MTQATPLDPSVTAPQRRGLLGHLAGALPGRRTADTRPGTRPGRDRAQDPSPDGVHGLRAPLAGAGAGAGGGAGAAADTDADAERVTVPGDRHDGSRAVQVPLARADDWLAARSGSALPTSTVPTSHLPLSTPAATPPTAPVRVPVWPAWASSTGRPSPDGSGAGWSVATPARRVPPLPAAARPVGPVTPTTSGAAPAPGPVVRVSARRPAAVRPAPVRPAPAAGTDPAASAVGTHPAAPARVPAQGAAAVPTPALARVPTPARVPVEEPPAATVPPTELVLADGRRVALTGTLLVGRNPAPRAGETVGDLVVVDDPARSVSKTHLAVGLDDAGTWVVDRQSTNGTVVTLPDGQRILCVPGRRVRLVVGASVLFGDHGFTLAGAPTGTEPR